MKGRYIFFVPGKVKFLDRTVYKVNNVGDVISRARDEWETNSDLRLKVNEYYKANLPDSCKVPVGIGFQSSLIAPWRYVISIDIR